MLFYVATGFGNKNLHNHVRDLLVAHGHRITYDWTQTIDEKGPSIAKDEIDGVVNADFVVVILPGKFGTHAELGAALAIANKVFLVGPREADCIFYEHPLVTDLGPGDFTRHFSIADDARLIAAIAAWTEKRAVQREYER